ncbi:hypothetical protein CRI94_14145 [Longibacter salinarum]|uniref:Uncharacterized protein n=1 Tax=Longibacter salinarum TaxID=1850348 RepID=A0A2A8CVM2_9BACT|nr:hypothetical protein [Longibacter salinarum]PEN12651.1 hypothetical protein CRI94_14145 [Longibacter salinarum]
MRRVFSSIEVECRNDVPARVHWNDTSYRVESLVECWVVETRWWADADFSRRVYYRLYTDRGVLEVFRSGERWILARVSD